MAPISVLSRRLSQTPGEILSLTVSSMRSQLRSLARTATNWHGPSSQWICCGAACPARSKSERIMLLMDDPRRLDEFEVQRPVRRLHDAAAGQPMRMPCRLTGHNDQARPHGEITHWLGLLRDEEQVSLPIL